MIQFKTSVTHVPGTNRRKPTAPREGTRAYDTACNPAVFIYDRDPDCRVLAARNCEQGPNVLPKAAGHALREVAVPRAAAVQKNVVPELMRAV